MRREHDRWCGTDRSSTLDGLMANCDRRVPHGWVTRIILAPRHVCQEVGPTQGLEKKKAMTAGLGPETDGLGAGSCLSGKQTTVSVY